MAKTKKQQTTIDGREVPLSNLDKVLFPDGQVRKADVIDFYARMAEALLPHLKDRPVTLKRYPNGALGNFFYEKDAPRFTPIGSKHSLFYVVNRAAPSATFSLTIARRLFGLQI